MEILKYCQSPRVHASDTFNDTLHDSPLSYRSANLWPPHTSEDYTSNDTLCDSRTPTPTHTRRHRQRLPLGQPNPDPHTHLQRLPVWQPPRNESTKSANPHPPTWSKNPYSQSYLGNYLTVDSAKVLKKTSHRIYPERKSPSMVVHHVLEALLKRFNH